MPTHRSPLRPVDSDGTSSPPDAGEVGRFLYRPIVFLEPERLVPPLSWVEHIPFAFWIVDALRPAVLVELGTQTGNSYASFAQAVQRLGLSTACYAVDTWQGDPQAGFYDESVFTEWAEYHDRHFAAFSRLIRSTFAEAAEHFSDATVDLLHIDGYHTYEAVAADFALWRPKLSQRSIVLFHDINVRERDFGAWRLWEELKAAHPSFEFLHGHGLGVLGIGSELPDPLRWLLSRPLDSPLDVSAAREFFARLGGVIAARVSMTERQAFSSEIEARGVQLAERDATIAALTSEVAQSASEREALRSRLQALSSEIEVRGVQLAERDATVSRLSADVHALRDRLATVSSDLHEQVAQTAQAAVRISSLEGQLAGLRSEHAEALALKNQLVADLQERLRDETERRSQVEAQLASLSKPMPQGPDTRLKVPVGARPSHWWKPAQLRQLSATLSALGLTRRRAKRMISPGLLRLVRHPARIREAHRIASSGLFDEAYYRETYPDVAGGRLTPLAHYVLAGAREGRNPHPLFDVAYYLRHNPDVASSGANPLVHYRLHGAFEGRSPHPLFDIAYYVEANPDVRRTGVEPLSHFLAFGAAEGRDPNPFFDCRYYLTQYPDVRMSGVNPLAHFARFGWREGRRPSTAFDPKHYQSKYPDIASWGGNPLEHYLECGRFEGRETGADAGGPSIPDEPLQVPQIRLRVRPSEPARPERPAVLCLSHVMPWPPRAGNEYRIYRMLRWLRDRGFRIVPLVAPLPGERVDASAVHALAQEFSNAVLCDRDGQLEYVLRDVPDVLASLRGSFTRPVATLLDENAVRDARARHFLQIDRTFCHDALITTALRLLEVLGPCVLLAEYIWMARVLPLVPADVLKVIDTHDVFSTRRQKVPQFGIDTWYLEPHEEAERLRRADLVLAIQDQERRELQKLVPATPVVTAGVDFEVVEDAGNPSGRRVLYVASDSPTNRKALEDFVRFAWPIIRRDVSDAELLVAGRVGQSLTGEVPGVVALGLIEDLRPVYQQASVAVNPAVADSGMKIRTLEALCHLRPIVTWPTGAEGLAPELAALCVTVRDWYEFSRRVADLLRAAKPPAYSPSQRETIVRLTSPAAAYDTMTDVIDGRLKERRARMIP